MNKIYPISMLSLIVVLGFTSAAHAQQSKIKTITIINGDTTISEKNIDEKEISDLEKQITMEINDDSASNKKTVKKIIINTDKDGEGDDFGNAFAYAFSNIDDKDAEIEVSSDAKGNKTKIIIKNDGSKSDSKEEKREKKVIRKSITMDDKTSKESMNLNINVKNTTAKIEVETGSKDPLNVSILDENGKQVFYDSQKDGSKYSKEINLDKKGTYFLNLIQNKKSTTENIIVK